MIMGMTTIAITKDMKDKISEFGNKGETYSDILIKIYNAAKKTQLRDLLMDETNTISIEEALENAKNKWLK